MDRRPWHGVLVATALPWNDDDTPDLAAYGRHVAWLAAHGCHGVTPNGSLGEYQLLTDAQRDAVVQAAVQAAPAGLAHWPACSITCSGTRAFGCAAGKPSPGIGWRIIRRPATPRSVGGRIS